MMQAGMMVRLVDLEMVQNDCYPTQKIVGALISKSRQECEADRTLFSIIPWKFHLGERKWAYHKISNKKAN